MLYAWLDKESLFDKHLKAAHQLIEMMEADPEQEVPLVSLL